jgi:acetoin utilization protein AcuB
MIVSEVMNKNPQVVEVTEPVRRAATLLLELDVRHLPVVEDGELVGILSDRDLRSIQPAALGEPDNADELRALLAQPVSTLMSSDVVTFEPEDDLADVVDSMVELRIGAVPIVAAGSRELVGIVSHIDILRAARDLL